MHYFTWFLVHYTQGGKVFLQKTCKSLRRKNLCVRAARAEIGHFRNVSAAG
jgi:hypothetical protein